MMTNPQGMDEMFWGRDHEDVNEGAKHLTMVAEVKDFNDDKLFKITKLNLCDQAKEWFNGSRNLIHHRHIGMF
jgi:hypothetical protein